MALEPRNHVRCHVCDEKIYDRDFGLVCWRFRVDGRCLPSAQVCHDACRDPSAYPYSCTLRDFIDLSDLFRAYFATYIMDGSMAEQPIWEVASRVYVGLDRSDYFAFDRDAYEGYFRKLQASSVAQGS